MSTITDLEAQLEKMKADKSYPNRDKLMRQTRKKLRELRRNEGIVKPPRTTERTASGQPREKKRSGKKSEWGSFDSVEYIPHGQAHYDVLAGLGLVDESNSGRLGREAGMAFLVQDIPADEAISLMVAKYIERWGRDPLWYGTLNPNLIAFGPVAQWIK